jgi:hypothetical protein
MVGTANSATPLAPRLQSQVRSQAQLQSQSQSQAIVRTTTQYFNLLVREFVTVYDLIYPDKPANVAFESQPIDFFESFLSWYKHHSGRSFGFLEPKLSYVMMRFSNVDAIDVVPNLTVNSANCKFTYMNAIKGGTSIPLFVKLTSVGSHADNPVIDNVNAQILRSIAKGSPAEKHIMDFFDSFLTYHPVSRSQWSVPEHDNMTRWPQRAQPAYARASLMSTIMGLSVSKVQKPMLNDVVFAFVAFFMNVIVDLGVHYGMVHNDLHLGNLFYEPKTKTIVMIDYGRMYVGAAARRPDLVPMISFELYKYAMPHQSIGSYEVLIDAHGSKGVYNPDAEPKVCIMDAITVVANMYRLLRSHTMPFMRIFEDMIAFTSNEDIKIASTDPIALLRLYCTTDDAYKRHPSREFIRFVKIMNEGLLLLALLVLSRAPERPKDFIYTSFQFRKKRSEYDKYIGFLDQLFGDLQMTDLELYEDFMGRTVLLSKMTWRANMVAGGGAGVGTTALSMRRAASRLGASVVPSVGPSVPSVPSVRPSVSRAAPSVRLAPIAKSALSPSLQSTLTRASQIRPNTASQIPKGPKGPNGPKPKPLFDPIKEWGPRSAASRKTKPTHAEIMASLEAFANKNVGAGGERLNL